MPDLGCRQSACNGRGEQSVALQRGTMSPQLALFALLALLAPARSEYTVGVCSLPMCKCAPDTHPSWVKINCTIPTNQKFDILEGDLPESTTELTLNGAEAIMFGPNSLSQLKDARHVRIAGPKLLVLRKYSAININVVNLYLDIRNVDLVRMEERTFYKVQGPLSVTIKNCDYVSLAGEVFSWLLSINVINVRKLELGQGSFALDPSAANVGQHGPGMSVELVNTTIPELPAQTFGSSAARVYLESVDVRGIRSGAFTANTYNIVMAVNCNIHLMEEEAFAPKSLIHNLHFIGCKIQQMSSKAIQSAVVSLNFSKNSFDNIETGAINTTVAVVEITDCIFHKIMEKGLEFSSWNKLRLERNSFDELVPNAIVAPDALLHVHEFVFNENEIETMHANSLGFIGQVAEYAAKKIVYKNNYYGQKCHCNITQWLALGLGTSSGEPYIAESYCTVDEFFARCFNEPEQNMKFPKFINGVCNPNQVQCEAIQKDEQTREIKNPRFPHKNKQKEPLLRDRDKKVIGIVIVTVLGCIIIAMLITFIKCLRREGYCLNIKNILLSSNSSCGSFCDRLCTCGRGNGLDNARSISQISVNEYSERHRLNEPRVQEMIQETSLQEVPVEVLDKTTQTLPEELTKELLENLKQKLEVPDNYVEAREMIEHLYEIAKMEELGICPANTPVIEENIYELPYQDTIPRVGRNNKKMISVGTRAPSLDKLLPMSPYNRQTALAHEYFEPLDMAIHLYAEITQNDKEKKNLLGAIPDVIAEQAAPRGPYLRAVREKLISSSDSSPSHRAASSTVGSPLSTFSMKSYNSNSSGKMLNRPLPEAPTNADAGEGTSYRHG